MNRVRKVSLLEDAVHLAVNTGIVYLGIAGVYAYRMQESFFEELRDPKVFKYALLGGGLIAGYKIARRIYDYLQSQKEKDKNNGEKLK